jgi:GTP-binding protein EngB required for normal cell division
MPGLNENHKRRIFASFKYADELLSQSLNAVAPARPGLYSRCIEDITPSELRWVENYAEKIREQMNNLLERFQIELPPPSTPSSWVLKTNLTTLDIALEEIYPKQMRGYGEMDQTTAGDLTWTLQEIRRFLSQLFAFLAEARGSQEQRLAKLQAEPALVGSLRQLSQVISRHGLVEFLPAMNSITRKLESHRYEIAVFGRVSSGKSSLINRLLEIELLPVGTTPITAVPIHIVGGPEPKLQITFMDRASTMRVEDLPEFATEQGNPGNTKRVLGLEVMVPSKRLQDGVAFVDTPGIASLATTATRLAYAYLPDSDFGIVLVDSQSTIGRDDMDILRALHLAGIPSVVMISKCDLLSAANVDKVLGYTRDAIAGHLGFSQDVMPISSVESWVSEMDRWFEKTIHPLLMQARESLMTSMNRKLLSLRNSLLATLELRASHRPDARGDLQDFMQFMRPIDESLEEFDGRWKVKLERISDCKEEVLENAAVQMAEDFSNNKDAGRRRNYENILSDLLIRSIVSRCNPFLVEYQSLSEKISDQLASFQKGKSESQCQYYEPPKPSELPAPVLSLLDGTERVNDFETPLNRI